METPKKKLRTIKIQGRDYVQVSERILAFHEIYPNGSISTQLVTEPLSDRIVIKAYVIPDVANPTRVFTSYSQATVGDGYINKTSALENCCTSATGRALAYLGIGIVEGVASADEINKAKNTEKTLKIVPAPMPEVKDYVAPPEKRCTSCNVVIKGAFNMCYPCSMSKKARLARATPDTEDGSPFPDHE